MFNFVNQKNKGFTILFSVLVSSLVLSIGASIISIALKQVTLSSSARDSQFAFYAANTGTECAMYWDIVGISDLPPVFATSSESVLPNTDNNPAFNAAQCNELSIIDNSTDDCTLSNSKTWCIEAEESEAVTKFRIKDIGGLGYCADVLVKKEYESDEDRIETIIESRGYNTCDSSNPRRIERGLRFRY